MGDQFVSYAQNGEDVVLWRALQHVESGRYVDVGALDPEDLSVTKALYDRGWRGLNIEPIPDAAARLAEARPDDEVLQAAITDTAQETVRLHRVVDTGLSTLIDDLADRHAVSGREVEDLEVPAMTLADAVAGSRLAGADVHVLKVDVEGSEAEVLAGLDLGAWRPWVLVIEATLPNSTETTHAEWEPEVLDSDYEFCLFDGLNRFYVATEHAELKAALSYPACALDDFVRSDLRGALQRAEQAAGEATAATARIAALEGELATVRAELAELNGSVDVLAADLVHWRTAAIQGWADATAEQPRELHDLRAQLGAARVQAAEARERLGKARARARRQRARADRLDVRLQEILDSNAWRATRPLRAARRLQLRLQGRSAQ